ncbi:RNA polymerase sigma-70 factor [Bacteroides heparinolyticus]|uniref:RNA polymerase sigma-70 factor n=1 Tax=Prevotella heparinolytica TaxID=28113 RepID=UPI0023F4C7C3|nr:RNA polymerase sigma-70 factor [Bacteroides heparinolyticus]MCI6213766.1 RNA polymerase sigma-70 factor [Bacteroides heparinolyticus]
MNRNGIPIDLASFNRLFTEYNERFVRFALTYVDDYMEAEDIVMEAMTYYWENRARLDNEVHPPTYIFASIKNKCLNHLRDRQYRQALSEQLQEHAAWKLSLQIATLEACNPEELLSKEMHEVVSRALNRLPETTRQIFLMHRFGEKSYREIALEMNMSVRGVEYHINKATRSLKKYLRNYLPLLLYLLHY